MTVSIRGKREGNVEGQRKGAVKEVGIINKGHEIIDME